MDSDIQKRFAQAFASAMHSLHCLAGKVMKSNEVPLAQYRLLMLLKERGPTTVSDIAALLGVAQSTASELAARAVESGWLARTPDPQDGRRALYSLNKSAQKMIKNRRRQMETIYAAVLDPLSPEEQEHLVAAFETIANLLKLNQTK